MPLCPGGARKSHIGRREQNDAKRAERDAKATDSFEFDTKFKSEYDVFFQLAEKGDQSFDAGNHKQAIAYFLQAYKMLGSERASDLRTCWLTSYLGDTCSKLGLWKDAIMWYKVAVAAPPVIDKPDSRPYCLHQLARCYRSSTQWILGDEQTQRLKKEFPRYWKKSCSDLKTAVTQGIGATKRK